uniref:hypothetical protein n=1 Tax=uncultured Draconibacterium sp. TaxID=1573823 RepID=UPI003216AE35
MKIVVFLFAVLLFVSCTDEANEDTKINTNLINIYLVEDDQTEFNIRDTDIDALTLAEEPWIKSTDIEFYDWSAHSFFLNKEIDKSKHSGRYFVVTHNNDRLFAGVLWPLERSSLPMCPSVSPENGIFSPKDVFMFNRFGWSYPVDMNNKTEFKAALLADGLLRNGIEVELNRAEKQSSQSVSYTFTIGNTGNETLYVPDPDKMGASRFHYYTNGVSFRQGTNYYFPQNFTSIATEKIAANWYVKLSPGATVTRTVTIDGFDSLPTGSVKATFSFPGGHIKESGQWKKPDGRIWLGQFVTEKELNIE